MLGFRKKNVPGVGFEKRIKTKFGDPQLEMLALLRFNLAALIVLLSAKGDEKIIIRDVTMLNSCNYWRLGPTCG